MSGRVISGACLCGKVTVELQAPANEVEICQCSMCRRWGGSFYSGLAGEEYEIGGKESITAYKSSNWGERAFCQTCGSTLWFRFLPTDHRSFSAGLFDDATALGIEKEIFADEAAEWCRLRGDHPRQTGEEVMAEAREAGFTFD